MKKVLTMCVVIGFAAVSQAALVDDFESYSTGNLGTVAHPPWNSVNNAASGNVQIGQANGNKYFDYFAPSSANVRGGALEITAIPDTSTASTFFLRFYAETLSCNNTFGLSYSNAPGNVAPTSLGFNDYNVMMRVNGGTFDVRSGGVFTTPVPIQQNTWYNVWAVVNQSADTFDVYLTSGTADATAADEVTTGAAFRNPTTAPLVTFAALVQGFTGAPAANVVRLDDLYQFDGAVLTNPIPEPATITMMVLGLGGLFSRKRK